MNHIICTYPSECLSTNVTFQVLLPKERPSLFKENVTVDTKSFKTLYLLHGAFDSAESWISNTNITSLVDKYNIAVILPSANNSFYLDYVPNKGYYTYISKELLDYTREIFPLSPRREDTFIGGISMGGYGAVRTALLNPNNYEKAFSLSGALNIQTAARFIKTCSGTLSGTLPVNFQNINHLQNNEYDISFCLKKSSESNKHLPALYISCGENDFFFSSSKNFVEEAESLNFNVTFEKSPGDHDWNFWNIHLEDCIKWLINS